MSNRHKLGMFPSKINIQRRLPEVEFFLRKTKLMNSPLEKPKHIKQLKLFAEKKLGFPQCTICFCFDFHAVQLLHTIFLTSSLP